MIGSPPPAWLARFQAQFSSMLRTPLNSDTGTFRAQPTEYPEDLCSTTLNNQFLTGGERLAVYNRQYWFRIFTVMQADYPLTARLLGLWQFNHWVQKFILLCPPKHYDITHIGGDFCGFLERHVPYSEFLPGLNSEPHLPRLALLQAAHLDALWQQVWLASEQARWQPSLTPPQELEHLRFKRSLAFGTIEVDWPLLQLRQEVLESSEETAIALPKRLPQSQVWALFRSDNVAIGQLLLAPAHAQLLRLLQNFPLGEALARLEAEYPATHYPKLSADVQAWLSQSVVLGFWESADCTFDQGAPE